MKNEDIDVTYEEFCTRIEGTELLKKLRHSVELLRKAERLALAYDADGGYYLAFSGGKDSQCLYHVARMAGVRFCAHMNLTSVDPPEVIRFVKREYPGVELVKPKDSIFNIAIRKKLLPTMRIRWCCEVYKESAGAGRVTLIGIRKAESARRAKRNEVEISSHKFSGDLAGLDAYREERANRKWVRRKGGMSIVNANGERVLGCINGNESLLISPIIEWTEKDVWTFLNTLGVSHCELYDQGFSRIGCIGCPMEKAELKKKSEGRWPHVRRNWIRAIKEIRAMGGIQRWIPMAERAAWGGIREQDRGRACRACV